jgi:hypothetical protein
MELSPNNNVMKITEVKKATRVMKKNTKRKTYGSRKSEEFIKKRRLKINQWEKEKKEVYEIVTKQVWNKIQEEIDTYISDITRHSNKFLYFHVEEYITETFPDYVSTYTDFYKDILVKVIAILDKNNVTNTILETYNDSIAINLDPSTEG